MVESALKWNGAEFRTQQGDCYDQALAEVARHLGVLAHKGGQLEIAEWDLLAILPTVIVATRNHLTRGNG